VATTRTEDVQK